MSWILDKAHSKVEFSVRHMMISRVRGGFQGFDAEVALDLDDLTKSTVSASIDVNSIDTKQEGRDNHLRSADFFDAANFPTMTFKSTAVSKKGDDEVEVTGDLTIRGTTQPVTLKGEIQGPVTNPLSGKNTVGFSLDGAIDREDFGLTWNKAMETGGVLVGKKISLHIEAEIFEEG